MYLQLLIDVQYFLMKDGERDLTYLLIIVF